MVKVSRLHSWDLKPKEAVELQASLRSQLQLVWEERPVHLVGGVDIALSGDQARAALVVLHYPDLKPTEAQTAEVPLTYPYIPGLLTFREGPAVLAAWEKLHREPDLLMFDGQGIAHPRGIGIAAHMGLWLPCPTIGVAKSRLYGRHVEPGPEPGDYALLYDPQQPDQVIGAVLRTKRNVKPLYISPGNHIDVAHTITFVQNCTAGYRLPEPTRWAHNVAGGASLPTEEVG